MLFTLQAFVNKVFHKLNSLLSKGCEGATGQGGLVLAASQLRKLLSKTPIMTNAVRYRDHGIFFFFSIRENKFLLACIKFPKK